MNESTQSSVTESLSADQETQPSESKIKIILMILAILLVLVGLARFFLVGNREESSATTPEQSVPAPSFPTVTAPAVAPKQGKDFGF